MRHLKVVLYVCLLVLLSVPVSGQEVDALDETTNEGELSAFQEENLLASTQGLDPVSLEAFLDGIFTVQLKQYNTPGAVVSVVKNGQVILSKGYGYANVQDEVAASAKESLFRPGSVSKLFVWTAVMQLVEDGRLELERDVNEYLDFTIPYSLATNREGSPSSITLEHLLNHTAGFEDKSQNLFVFTAEEIKPLGQYLKAHLPARVFPPGEIMAYSNYGSSLAAYIVEQVTGQSFASYVQEHIFGPLGMHNSTFLQPVPDSITAHQSQGYAYVTGTFHEGDFEYCQSYPAGGLSSTAEDMAMFMLAHLDSSDANILNPETLQQMHSQSYTHHEQLEGMSHGFMEMERNGYRILTHGGDTFLFHSGLYLIPEENLGIFVSYNGSGATLARKEFFAAFMDRYFPATASADQGQSASGEVPQIAGTYQYTRSNYSTFEGLLRILQPVSVKVEPSGTLLLSTPLETIRYTAGENNVFYGSDNESKLTVAFDDQGAVKYLLPNAPFAMVPAPWYETLGFTAFLLVGYLLLFTGTVIKWVANAFSGRPGQRRMRSPLVPKLVLFAFGALFIVLLGWFTSLAGDLHPTWGVPKMIFRTPSELGILMSLPWLLLALAVSSLVINFQVWNRMYFNLVGRIHFTLLTAWSLAIIWWLFYWRFFHFFWV